MLPKRNTIEDLKTVVESVVSESRVCDVFSDGLKIRISSSVDYQPGERDRGLQEAWDDFKWVLGRLRKHSIGYEAEENMVPEWDSPDWEIVVPLNKNLFVQL